MRTRLVAALVIVLTLTAGTAAADSFTFSFTAADVKTVMAGYGDSLHDSTYQWGLWSVRAMPIVSGGSYDILSASVTSTSDWWAARPSSREYAYPYFEDSALFHAVPGSEHLDADGHPLYLIADQPVTTFQSYAFDSTTESYPGRSRFTEICTNDPTLPGCNETRGLLDSTVFTFSFMLADGASWLGWQFLVDGSKYFRPGDSAPDNRWVMDFYGGHAWLPYVPYRQDQAGGGLAHNVGDGYQVFFSVPEPGTLSLLALGLVGFGATVRRRART